MSENIYLGGKLRAFTKCKSHHRLTTVWLSYIQTKVIWSQLHTTYNARLYQMKNYEKVVLFPDLFIKLLQLKKCMHA